MLVRLESSMERNDLIEEMLLLPDHASAVNKLDRSTKPINLIVGYNASPKSQTALDLTMWIAHQTRLVTQNQVTVQVVYVLEENLSPHYSNLLETGALNRESGYLLTSKSSKESTYKKVATSVLAKQKYQKIAITKHNKSGKQRRQKLTFSNFELLEQADRILWQARSLAEEWRGSFKAHLRFGDVATQLREVIQSEAATLLFLGCNSVNHPLVQQLGCNLPCSVLGIPTKLSLD
jgi:hypothetical protein